MSKSLLPINIAQQLVMYNSDQITNQLWYLQDQKLLMLHWHSFYCIDLSISAAINNSFHNDLNLKVAMLSDWELAQRQSQSQWYSYTSCYHSIKICISCWMIHCACFTSLNQLIFTCDCLRFSHIIPWIVSLVFPASLGIATDSLCAII